MAAVFPGGFPRRGELYRVDLDPTQGSEITGTRPAVVLSNDDSNELSDVVTVAPTTSTPARKKWLHEVQVPAGIGGLTRPSRVLINQIRTISKKRLVEQMGILPPEYVQQCDAALQYHFNLPTE